jgi:hypothetical protein
MDQQDQNQLIGNRPTRSPWEIILKNIAITTTTTFAVGHLSTLQGKEFADTIIAVIGFLIWPPLPLASLLWSIWKACLLCWNKKRTFDAKYFMRVALGVRAVVKDSSAPEILERSQNGVDSKWMGRLVVLLFFEIQAVMTTILAVRRIWYLQSDSLACWDIRNGLMAFGGAVTGATSILVIVLNVSWNLKLEQPAEEATQTEIPTPIPAQAPDRPATEAVGRDPADAPTHGPSELAEQATEETHAQDSIKTSALARPEAPTEPAIETRARGSTYILMAFLHPRLGDEDCRWELGLAKIINALLAIPLKFGQKLPATNILLLPLYAHLDRNQKSENIFSPAYDPFFVIVVKIVVSGVSLLRDTSSAKGAAFAIRIFLNANTLVVTGFFVYWFQCELRRLIDYRQQGLWLDIMLVDPLAEKLYVF